MARDKCSYFKKYKAIYRPKCDCIACREKYIDKLELQNKLLRDSFDLYKSQTERMGL